jgi:GMP synthase (glutamine-hydrolysing)
MRLNECEQVKETLDKHLGINLTVVNGAELFLGRLKGVNEPEKKRKIIGATCMFTSSNLSNWFLKAPNLGTVIDLFQQEALRIEKEAEDTPNAGPVEWFLQGTVCTSPLLNRMPLTLNRIALP